MLEMRTFPQGTTDVRDVLLVTLQIRRLLGDLAGEGRCTVTTNTFPKIYVCIVWGVNTLR